MRPSDLIKHDLGEELWAECILRMSSTDELPVVEELSPFLSSKTYFIYGKTGQFDFPTLPHGSYCIYVADGRKATRLTRQGKEIESVLKVNWQMLTECNPVVLANLILTFFDGGIRSTHHILPDADAICCVGKNCVLNDREFAKSEELIGVTSISRCDDAVVIRAVTLCGWMHDKRNLGIENIRILKSGEVELDKRIVLSKKIFKSVPQIRY